MKENRRRMPALIAALILICAAAVLAGCGAKKPTAQSLAKTASEKMAKVSSANVFEHVLFEGDMDTDSLTMDLTLNINADMDVTTRPVMAHAKVRTEVSALGENEVIKSESYSEKNGDKVVVYSTADGENWTQEEQALADSDLTGALENNLYAKIADGTIQAELAEETVEVNGQEAYVLSLTLDGNQIGELMGGALSSMEDMLKDLDLSGTTAPVKIYISKDSGYPVRMELDALSIGEALFGQLGTLLGESANVQLKTFSVAVDMSKFNEIDPIKVPQEVRDSAQAAQEAPAETEISDMVGNLEQDIENFDDAGDYQEEMQSGKECVLADQEGKVSVKITVPDGFDELSYSDTYASAYTYMDDDSSASVFYYLFENETADHYLSHMDGEYMHESADYSNIEISDVKEFDLDGTAVKYKTMSFDFQGTHFIQYNIAVPAQNGYLLSVEIDFTGEKELKVDGEAYMKEILSHVTIGG